MWLSSWGLYIWKIHVYLQTIPLLFVYSILARGISDIAFHLQFHLRSLLMVHLNSSNISYYSIVFGDIGIHALMLILSDILALEVRVTSNLMVLFDYETQRQCNINCI